jgi:hypothetical protein
MNSQSLRVVFGSGLLLCSVAVASANSLVTFQVDMSNAAFDPGTQTVTVRGNFNGWGTPSAFLLTNNPSGPTPGIWSGTADIAQNSNVIAFKYVIEPGTQYESSHNRLLALPTTSGGSATAALPYYNDTPPTPITVSVTFQVNMAQAINTGAFDPLNSIAHARGGFNGWAATDVLTNDPSIHTTNQFGLVSSNVYVKTIDITGSPGQTIDYKFHIDNGVPLDNWENLTSGGDPNDNNNRFLNLANAATQALPIFYFNNNAYAPKATNDVTFQVDMTAQVRGGNFDPATGSVYLRGDMTSWATSQVTLTNDPAAPNTNLYKGTVTMIDGIGATHQFKYASTVTANGGWEIVAGNPGLNRTLQIVSGLTQTLAPVFFSDTTLGNVLTTDTTITVRVDMTGAVGTDAHVFDPINDSVYVGGFFLDNLGRWIAPFSANDLPIQMTNNPVGSSIWSVEIPLTRGAPLPLTYKFGINGSNNEPNGNHVRYVAGTTGSFTLPLDKFGVAVTENATPNLTIAKSTAGHVALTWQGRPGVYLQTKASLGSGSWVNHPETDGLSSYDATTSDSAQYFRLVKP